MAFFTQDVVNGYFVWKRLLPGTETCRTVFTQDGYISTMAAAETRWNHEQVKGVYETEDYFVFFLSDRHGQIYDKHGFTAGTHEEFRAFISEQTGKPVEYIK